MSKNKNRKNVTEEAVEVKNAPQQAEEVAETKEIQDKEDNEMDLEEVKQNFWQRAGEALVKHGDKKAAYKKEHPVASKVKTGVGVGIGVLVAAGTAGFAYVKNSKKKQGEVEDFYANDDLYEDLDDDEVEVTTFGGEDESEAETADETSSEE